MNPLNSRFENRLLFVVSPISQEKVNPDFLFRSSKFTVVVIEVSSFQSRRYLEIQLYSVPVVAVVAVVDYHLLGCRKDLSRHLLGVFS